MSFGRSILTVWLRYFAVFRKNILYGLITTFVEPLMYLASFGFGLGGVIGSIDVGGQAYSYRSFVLSGLIGQTVLFTAFFDGAYGGFVRMYYQKVYHAIAVTPVTLAEVLWGELLWCSSRALLSTSAILAIGTFVGDFHGIGSALVLPLAFIGALLFAAIGMLAAALSPNIDALSYPQYLLIFPMFLFCGVYFPISNLPDWIQWAAMVLPLTALLSLARTLVLGFPFEAWALCALIGWTALLVPYARRSMFRRLLA